MELSRKYQICGRLLSSLERAGNAGLTRNELIKKSHCCCVAERQECIDYLLSKDEMVLSRDKKEQLRFFIP